MLRIEIEVNGKIEAVEIEEKGLEKFEAMAKERNITLDALLALLLKSACAEAERGI